MKVFLRYNVITVLILWLALAGCVGQPSPPTNFYMLAPLIPPAGETPAATEKGQTVIAIMDVLIPSYLDRNQIVTRLNEIEYGLAEFDQWAEPINENLTRVIAQNLSRLLASDAVDVFPAAKEVPHEYRIGVEVIRLDGKLRDHVTLIARWAISEADQEDLIVLRKFEHQEKIEDNTPKKKSQFQTAEDDIPENYKGLVMAQSRAVEKLSRDIAAAVKEILKKP
jgi:uncharacterized lipoprotein YmbA